MGFLIVFAGGGIGAHDEECAGHRVDRDRAARQQEAEKRRDQQSGQAGFMADPARHQFARQDHGDEGADQTAGKHFRQHLGEQRQVAAKNLEDVFAAVAPIDGGRGAKGDRCDDRGRPVEGAPAPFCGDRIGQGARTLVERMRVVCGVPIDPAMRRR